MSQIIRLNYNMLSPQRLQAAKDGRLRGTGEEQLWQPHFSKTTKHNTKKKEISKAHSM